MFLAEKTAASRPLTYDKRAGGQRPRAEEGHRQVHRPGFCVQTTWATMEWMTVLLAKPIDAPCEDTHEYEVEESSAFMGFSVSSTDGVLLGVHRVKDATIGLYDGKDGSFEYARRGGPADRRRFASAAAAARAPETRGQAQRGRRPRLPGRSTSRGATPAPRAAAPSTWSSRGSASNAGPARDDVNHRRGAGRW